MPSLTKQHYPSSPWTYSLKSLWTPGTMSVVLSIDWRGQQLRLFRDER